MGGGSKSSSSSASDYSQTTQSASGINTGQQLAVSGASTLNYQNEFSSGVQAIMSQLIDTAAAGLELAVKTVSTNTQDSLSKVAAAAAQASQPDLEIVKSQSTFMPWILVAAFATIAIVLRKK